MLRSCCNRFICPGGGDDNFDFPIANLSSEAPDPDLFIGWTWKWDRNQPSLITHDFNPQPPFICESAVSQELADLCARTGQLPCTVDGCPTGQPGWTFNTGGNVPVFFSHEQSATVTCPDGSPFTYTLAAGAVSALKQADADLMARSYAEKFARQHKLCLSIGSTECCATQPFSTTITATGLTLSPSVNLWTLVAGSLPSGLTLQQGNAGSVITLTGTPTEAGFFTFSVRVVTPVGDSVTKTFTLCSIAIVNPETLPPGQISLSYFEQLLATGCASTPLSWQVVGGSIPPGLTLDEETGIISGTPTGLPASYNFTIRLQTSAT